MLPVILSVAVLVARASACNDELCNLNGKCIGTTEIAWDVKENQNNVWGRPLNCGSPTTGDSSIKFLGKFTNAVECFAACNETVASGAFRCTDWTFHDPLAPVFPECLGTCYATNDSRWGPVAQPRVTSGRGPHSIPKCSCYPGWKGADCGILDLKPLQTQDGKPIPAYGTEPSAESAGVAAWGASIVKDPATGLYHMFAAEMGLQCGLNSWFRNSIIVHATSATAEGPYRRKEELLTYFAHEPVVVTLPDNAGFVLYKIGCADHAKTGSNGTWLHGPCTGCHNGSTSGLCPPADQSYERACQDVLFAPSLDGPWIRHDLAGFGSEWNWRDLTLGLESHAPVVLDNGTILTFTRSWGTPTPLPNSAIWLVRADSWNGTYALVPDVPQPVFGGQYEDTFMWRDGRGNFHGLFHSWKDPDVGAHAFSRDGLVWVSSNTTAYTLTEETRNSSEGQEVAGSVTFARRERPKLLLDSDGNPTQLITAVTPLHGIGEWWSQKDWSYALVQGVNRP